MIEEFDSLFRECSPAFKQSRSAKRTQKLAYGLLNCLSKHTLSGMITSSGQQFVDWSSAYRLFQGSRINIDYLFSVVRESLLKQKFYVDDKNIYSHMDDTILKKTGKKIVGTSWRRDPLGLPFHTNFTWGQRYLQLAISLPEKPGGSRSRAIPVDFYHAPTVKKPRKTDSEEHWNKYKIEKKKTNLSLQGIERLKAVRENIDNQTTK